MITGRNIERVTEGLGSVERHGGWDSSPPLPHEERASGIPRRSESDRKEDPGSPLRSGTGSEKVPAQDLWDAEDEMSVGNLLEHVQTEPFPEFHHPLLMAGGTEV